MSDQRWPNATLEREWTMTLNNKQLITQACHLINWMTIARSSRLLNVFSIIINILKFIQNSETPWGPGLEYVLIVPCLASGVGLSFE